jgi:hypothetical protein
MRQDYGKKTPTFKIPWQYRYPAFLPVLILWWIKHTPEVPQWCRGTEQI